MAVKLNLPDSRKNVFIVTENYFLAWFPSFFLQSAHHFIPLGGLELADLWRLPFQLRQKFLHATQDGRS